MKRLSLILIFILCIFNAYSTDTNTTSFGGKQVEPTNILFIDFSNSATQIVFSILLILLVLSFMVVVHPLNSFILLFFSIIMMANGFNLIVSFILLLISIALIGASTKK